MKSLNLSHKNFNPNFHHLKIALADDNLRYIFLYGGSSSSKSYSLAQAILLDCLGNGNNTLVFRKTGASIADSIYKSFSEACKNLGVDELFKFKINKVDCVNGSYITFKGLDEPEKIKGLESYKYVVCEELSDFDEADFKQIRKRLRGREGQKIISTFNPISKEHWIKTNIFDKENFTEVCTDLYPKLKNVTTKEVLDKKFSNVQRKQLNAERAIVNPNTGKTEIVPPDTLVIKSTYLNNFWVVGSPDGTYGYYDKATITDFEKDKENDKLYYDIYALGEWGEIKTGGEFLESFNYTKHVKEVSYNKNYPIHISIDNNVLPYIAISFWQKIGNTLYQINEISAGDPFNTVLKAAELACMYLKKLNYNDVLFLHGDATTKSSNTIDDEKRSFFDKFLEKLGEKYSVRDMIIKKNPNVAMSGEFLNAILKDNYAEIEVVIGDHCKKSVEDYNNAKKDVNGGMLKQRVKDKLTGQTYEKFGHFCDIFRYCCVNLFSDEYIKFSNRRIRNEYKDDSMKYFDVTAKINYTNKLLFVMTECNNKNILTLVGINKNFIDILDVSFNEDKFDVDKIIPILKKEKCGCVMECDKNYMNIIKELREGGYDVFGRSKHRNAIERINAYNTYIKDNVRLKSNFEEFDEYFHFVANILDYNGKTDYEALNMLSFISGFLIKKVEDYI